MLFVGSVEQLRIYGTKNHINGHHYSWDDWVPQDRVRKFTEENKELAAQLHTAMKEVQESKAPKSAKKGGRANGSGISSRGSEERTGSVGTLGGRNRRNRDYDLEHVSLKIFLSVSCLHPLK